MISNKYVYKQLIVALDKNHKKTLVYIWKQSCFKNRTKVMIHDPLHKNIPKDALYLACMGLIAIEQTGDIYNLKQPLNLTNTEALELLIDSLLEGT